MKAFALLLLLHAPAYAQSLQQQIFEVRERANEHQTELATINEWARRSEQDMEEIKATLDRHEALANQAVGFGKLLSFLGLGSVAGLVKLWHMMRKGKAA